MPVWPLKRQGLTNSVMMWSKGNTCILLGELCVGTATMEYSMKNPQKLKIELPHVSAIPHLGI